MASQKVAVGIDLGTTNSCVAVVRNGHVDVIANDQGSRTTPSVVAFTDNEVLVGEAAKAQASFNPSNTIFDAKRLIGRKYNDPDAQRKMDLWPFKVFEDTSTEKPMYDVKYKENQKIITPEEISSIVLKKMKKTAEDYLGQTVTHAVITVPAYFNDAQRQATMDAATIADLKVLELINEPTAAAIAYGFDKKVEDSRNILIFDLGGGTFDVVLLDIEKGNFIAKAVSGDTYLGGSDFDELIIDHLRKDFNKKTRMDLTESDRSLGKLRKAAEQAKRNLSSSLKERIQIECLYQGVDYETSLSRVRFEELCSDLFESTLDPIETVLKEARMEKDEIDEVVLVGGSTRIPKIQDLLQEFFEGKNLNKTINPDEAVAYGAALHAALKSGETSLEEYNLRDITPLSLGITVRGEEMSQVIPRNSKIPIQKTQIFTTHSNYQSSVCIEVREGERKLSRDNHLLGEFMLEDIQSALKGVPRIQVTFEINKNGILSVSACDSSSGSEKKVTIKGNARGLNKEEIKRMRDDHSKFMDDAEMEMQKEAFRSELEAFCSKMKNGVRKKRDKALLSQENFLEIDNACQEVQDWLDDNRDASLEDCQTKQKELKIFCARILKPE